MVSDPDKSILIPSFVHIALGDCNVQSSANACLC